MCIVGGTSKGALSTVEQMLIMEGVWYSREPDTPRKHEDEYMAEGQIKCRGNAFGLSSVQVLNVARRKPVFAAKLHSDGEN